MAFEYKTERVDSWLKVQPMLDGLGVEDWELVNAVLVPSAPEAKYILFFKKQVGGHFKERRK